MPGSGCPLQHGARATARTASGRLEWSSLPYHGALVNLEEQPALAEDPAAFRSSLESCLADWEQLEMRSAWLRVPLRLSVLMSTAAELGFEVHHGKGGHVMLKRWLRPDLPDKVPPLATHQVGVAGFVLNSANELLLVREWRTVQGEVPGMQREPAKSLKMPGGLSDAGESFGEAACREVWEETGLRCRFRSLLAFWHRHGLAWGTSDLYVVCLLEPEGDSTALTPDPEEISECRWMGLGEVLETQDHPLILFVLQKTFGLQATPEVIAAVKAAKEPLRPRLVISESAVQWPGREPFPTYHPVVGHDPPLK